MLLCAINELQVKINVNMIVVIAFVLFLYVHILSLQQRELGRTGLGKGPRKFTTNQPVDRPAFQRRHPIARSGFCAVPSNFQSFSIV